MVVVDHVKDLLPHVGQELGTSDWVTLSQRMLDQFGAVTGDQHWIHVDPERAAKESPFGGTIAHGFLTLSLLTGLLSGCFQVRLAKRWLNLGMDRLRFTAPVPATARVRLRLTLAELEMKGDGIGRLRCSCTMDIEGQDKPAFVTDYLMLAHE